MISRNKLEIFFRKKCDDIITSLNEFCESGNQEEIHKMRVEFKKLKALISLVNECSKNSHFEGEYRAAKIVYRRAGVVRDAYISKQFHEAVIVSKNDAENNYLEAASAEFCRKKDIHLNVITEWKSITGKRFENIENHCVISFYRKHLERLAQSFFLLEEEEIHECRKIIKRLLYLYPLVPPAVKNKLKININYLDALQEEIGKWHDTIVSKSHYSVSAKPDSKYLKRLEKEQNSRLGSIKLLVRNFDSKSGIV